MATQLESETDVGVGTLVTGIMQDAKQLITQQFTLFQVEIKNDLNRATTALIPLLAGVGVLLTSLVLLGVAGAYFLCWLIPDLPLWGGFAAVGTIVALLGAALVFMGKSQLEANNPLPEKSLQALKENLQWKTKN